MALAVLSNRISGICHGRCDRGRRRAVADQLVRAARTRRSLSGPGRIGLWPNHHTETEMHWWFRGRRIPAPVPPRFDSEPVPCRISVLGGGADWGSEMSSIFRARSSCLRSYLHSDVAVKANHIHDVSPVPAAWVRKIILRVAVVLSAASLAACAQSSVVSQKSGSSGASRQALQQHEATPTRKRVASAKAFPLRAAQSRGRNTGRLARDCQLLLAGTTTASGEKFNTHDLTAAHPTLPFGTKLRVTNVSTGRSVMVRVNDRSRRCRARCRRLLFRGECAGVVDRGFASVKLDVVQ